MPSPPARLIPSPPDPNLLSVTGDAFTVPPQSLHGDDRMVGAAVQRLRRTVRGDESSIAADLPPDRVLRTIREDLRKESVLFLGLKVLP